MFLRFSVFLSSLLAGLIPLVCNAATSVSIEGINTEGYYIIIDTESTPLSVLMFKETENSDLRRKSTQEFKNEPCVLKDTSLVCDKNGKSPLAGTTYIRHKNVKNKNGCVDPEFIYICKSGCDHNKLAPRELHQDHYEGCPDDYK